MNRSAPASPLPLAHYENFPVASWLCPPRLRPAIAAIYWFARTADDVADEGNAPAQQRLDDLAAYRADLDAVADARAPSPRWPDVFGPLSAAIQEFKLPVPLLADLLSAFEQDVAKSRDRAGYADRDELLDYCCRSANPVGRLLLHLYGVRETQALTCSDCICTALQLINFWQDLGLDIARGRFYLPHQDCEAHGVTQEDLLALRQTPDATKLIASHIELARATMLKGSALVHQVPGRAGWELRLVVQGGLRILDKIEAIGFATLSARPKLTVWDAPVMLWRSLWM
ncbi:MAG: squalene synthase HpnC [Rhodoferax sp.]